jgi:hypothetical protein
MAERFGYTNSMMKFFRFVHLPIFSIAAIVMAVQGIRGAVPASFALFFVLCVPWNLYWWFWRNCHTVEVDGNRLCWWSGLRHGEIAVSELTGNGTLFGMQKLKTRAGKSILVCGQGPGWIRFLEVLNDRHPLHPFRPTRLVRWGAKWSGSGGFSRYYER